LLRVMKEEANNPTQGEKEKSPRRSLKTDVRNGPSGRVGGTKNGKKKKLALGRELIRKYE